MREGTRKRGKRKRREGDERGVIAIPLSFFLSFLFFSFLCYGFWCFPLDIKQIKVGLSHFTLDLSFSPSVTRVRMSEKTLGLLLFLVYVLGFYTTLNMSSFTLLL